MTYLTVFNTLKYCYMLTMPKYLSVEIVTLTVLYYSVT